ncbi:LysE family translocator [Kineobactrum salinum]|uniref:LysE family transporter n=1 Tax=Kineobactrum salinum TaxID=2708301 RepID=A0A6C0U547_9GAMM|nr:LysE family transporter [Kineobactrum salinum]QIB67106.1 LysE family transporter [Kineobactrum salinum]
MSLSLWLSLLGVCLLGAMSPGPSLAVVLNNTVAGGRSAGLVCALSHGLAVGLYALVTVTGLALLIARSPLLFTGLQLAGAAYLVYLGMRSLRSSGAMPGASAASAGARPSSPVRAASSGFLVAFLNPKLAIFMLALFSQFLPAEPSLATHTLMVATVATTDTLWYALVALLIATGPVLQRLQRSARLVDKIFGILLIVLGLSVVLRLL